MADAAGPYSGDEGSPIALDGAASYDPDPGDSIVAYRWDLDDDGVFDDADGATPSYTWPDDGVYTIHLQVVDNHGASATDTTSQTLQLATGWWNHSRCSSSWIGCFLLDKEIRVT